jgi:hypothetical protein
VAALPAEPPRKLRLGSRIELDFGREVEGYLQLVFDRRAAPRALAGFRLEPATSAEWAPDVIVLAPANRGSWQDATPRRFRYVELIGLEEVSRIS